MMNEVEAWPLVQEFITKFGASLDVRVWRKLVEEELTELEYALEKETQAQVLKEGCDLVYVLTPFVALGEPVEKLGLFSDDEIEYTGELLHRAIGVVAKIGPMFEPGVFSKAFVRVHESNMSKLGNNGKPIRREDGKIMKGPNYKPPVLDDLLEAA